jgi:hypothetical protein
VDLLSYAKSNYELTNLQLDMLKLLEQDGQTWSRLIAPVDFESYQVLKIYERWQMECMTAC